MRGSAKYISLIAGLALTAAGTSVLPARAAPPTVVTDTTISVACVARSAGGERLVISAQVSETQQLSIAFAEVVGPDSQTIGEGSDGVSTWIDATVSATVPLYYEPPSEEDPHHWYVDGAAGDEDGPSGGDKKYVGEVRFRGTYEPAADAVTEDVRGKDGNIRYAQSNTVTPLDVEAHTLILDHGTRETTFAVDECSGEAGTGSLTYTNPRTLIQRASEVPYECTAVNASPWAYIERVEEGWYVDVTGMDPGTSASAVVEFAKDGTWQGYFRAYGDEEEPQSVPASATLVQTDRYHARNGEKGMRDHAQVDVHALHLDVQLPGQEPAQLDCTLWEAELTLRSLNPALDDGEGTNGLL